MKPIETIQRKGQSVWLDQAARSSDDTWMHARIQTGEITGLFSSQCLFSVGKVASLINNPDMRLLAHANSSAEQILKALIVENFRKAADTLLPIFEESNGEDGFITMDIDPRAYPDHEAVLYMSTELWGLINRPNLLISIPADEDMLPLIAALLEQGINLNASTICSLEQYLGVVEVYLQALEARLNSGSGIEHIVSIASFNIGEIDKRVNQILKTFTGEGVEALRAGALIDEVGLAIAKLAYAQFTVSFADDRFDRLVQAGGRVQRILWTGFDIRDEFPPWEYVQRLVSPGTLVGVSPEMLSAPPARFELESVIDEGLSEARGKLQALESIGVSMQQIAADIVNSHLKNCRHKYIDNLNWVSQEVRRLQLELEPIRKRYGEILTDLEGKEVSHRIWQADITLWTDERRAARKLSGHRGWLDIVSHMNLILEDCRSFSRDMEDLGVTELKVICPGSVGDFIGAVIQNFGHPEKELSLIDPGALEESDVAKAEMLDGTHYMFVIDGTNNQQMHENIEAMVKTIANNGLSDAADRISLIAASQALETIQQSTKGIQHTFSLPEDLPFHFSVLSYPGILAAAWLGIDPEPIRNGCASVLNRCLPAVPAGQNPGLAMAGAIEAGARTRTDRLELSADTAWFPFLVWIESFLIECGLFQGTGLELVRTEEPGKFEPVDAESLLIFLQDPASISGPIKDGLSKRNPVKMIALEGGAHSLGELAGLLFFTTAVLGHIQAVYPFARRV